MVTSAAVSDATTTAQRPRASPGTTVRWAGVLVVVVSVFGAAFPYVSNAAGLPLDGAPDGAMTLWRTALHLAPGVLGVAAGVALLARAPRLADWARLGVAVGGWFAVGPYVWALVEPGQSMGTGGLAGTMGDSWIAQVLMPSGPGPMVRETTATCAFTMGVDHWAVGALVILASLVALGAGAGRGPLAGLRTSDPA